MMCDSNMLAEGENMSLSEVELETLRSIYVNELDVQYGESGAVSTVSIQLYPATADNLEEQYVRMCLQFKLSEKYPDSIPEVSIRNPRGLLDEQIDRIIENLLAIAEKHKGSSMLFELIEAAKEQLTAENRPREDCAICLYGFFDEDVFMKTECYHYFHSHCLSRYVACKLNEADEEKGQTAGIVDKDGKRKVPCPICRIPISFKHENQKFPEPVAVSKAVVSFDLKAYDYRRMDEIYKRQMEKGGIIDVEAEQRKYLLEIANVPDETPSGDVDSVDSTAAADHVKDPGFDGTRAVTSTKSRSSPHFESANSSAIHSPVKSHHVSGGRHFNQNRRPNEDRVDSSPHAPESLETSERHGGNSGSRKSSQGMRSGAYDERSWDRPKLNGRYRNSRDYEQRNYGYGGNYRRGNPQNFRNRPAYNRRTHTDFTGNQEKYYRGRNNRSSAVIEENGKSRNSEECREHADDHVDSQQNRVGESDENGKFIQGEKQNSEGKQDETRSKMRPYSGTGDAQKTEYKESRSEQMGRSAGDPAERPASGRYNRRMNYKPKYQFPYRGNQRKYASNKEGEEPSTFGEQVLANNSQDSEDVNHTYGRSNYQNSGPPNRHYGDQRRYPRWQPQRRAEARNETKESRERFPRNRPWQEKMQGLARNSMMSKEMHNPSELSLDNSDGNSPGLRTDHSLKVKANSESTDVKDTVPCNTVPSKPLEKPGFPHVQKEVSCNHTEESAPAQKEAVQKCSAATLRSPPGFANPLKRVVYGLPSVNPPPGFHRS